MLRLLRVLLRLDWLMRLSSPLVGRFNPFSPDWRRDPYPYYRRLRETAPVYRSRLLGALVLTRYDDVLALLSDPRFSVRRGESRIFQRMNPFGELSAEFRLMIERNLLMHSQSRNRRLSFSAHSSSTRRRASIGPSVTPRIESSRAKTKASGSRGLRPVVAPQVTMRPPRAAASTLCSKVSPPTCSNTTSAPRPPVSARTRRSTRSLR